MKELDFLLERFLDDRAQTLDEKEIEAFEAILDMEDDTLWACLLGRRQTGTDAMDGIIGKIRSPHD